MDRIGRLRFMDQQAVNLDGFAVPDPSLGLFFAFWSWVGFETVAVYGEESKDPKRIVPKAVLIAVTSVGLLYIFMSWASIAGNGGKQAIAISQGSTGNSFDLYFGITKTFLGSWAKTLYQLLTITGSFACALAFHNTASRYIYALGREAPGAPIRKAFGATHAKHKSPHIASVTQTIITLVITLGFFWLQPPTKSAPDVAYFFEYGLLAIIGTAMVLISQALCSFAVIGYFHVQKKHPETASWWRTLLAPAVGGVAMIAVVYLLYHNLAFAAGAAASSPVYKATPYIVVGTFVIGIVFALVMRSVNPERYDLMGRTVLDEAGERS